MKIKLIAKSSIPSKQRKIDDLITAAHEKDKQQPQQEKPKNKDNNNKRNQKGNGKNNANMKRNRKRRMTKKEREDKIKKLTEWM